MGLSRGIRSKQGQVERNSTTSPGRCHKSRGDRLVGRAGQLKRCWVVCSVCRQHGQTSVGARPMRCLKELRAEEYPDRSWASVVLAPLGRSSSASSTSGALSDRTPFGLLLSIAGRTALVWIVFLVILMSVMQPSPSRSLTWSLKPDCSDCFFLLGPESAVTIGRKHGEAADRWPGTEIRAS